MRTTKLLLLLSIILFPLIGHADWAIASNLSSSTLWQLVSENRAVVVSSVGFGNPNELHIKQTVFKIIKATKSEGNISWAVKEDGGYRPVMCKETWKGLYTYLGSSCSIPGCLPEGVLNFV